MSEETTYYNPERFKLMHHVGQVPVEKHIHTPIAVVLGHLEKLTHEELHELRSDIMAEIARRNYVKDVHRTEQNDI